MSKYLKSFQLMKERAGSQYDLIGDCLIVEEIPPPEVTKKVEGTDKILYTATGGTKKVDGLDLNRPLFVRVLEVGNGYYDSETSEVMPLEVAPGDIILVGRQSVNWFSEFLGVISETGNQIGITREAEKKMHFKGPGAVDAARAALQEGLRNV